MSNNKVIEKRNKRNNISKFKSKTMKIDLNIGVIVFILIFIYLLGISITYFREHQINTYEVRYGSIIKDNAYRGVAIREETVYNVGETGYIQLYYNEGSRVGVNSSIYTISDNQESNINEKETTKEEETENTLKSLDTTNTQKILSEIQSFNGTYDRLLFNDTYKVKDNITSIINNHENADKITILDSIDPNSAEFRIYKSEQSGILMYTIDSYEYTTIDNITPTIFNKENYNPTKINSSDKVTNNSPIYKLITDENWKIVIEIAEKDLEIFQDMTSIAIRFISDDQIVYGGFEILNIKNQYYGVISMDSDMIRYINERFLDIELMIKEQEGYKIPVSSVVSKEFFKVPISYITKGGYYSSNGVLLVNETNTKQFSSQKIYYQDKEYVYLSTDVLQQGQRIMNESTSDIFVLSEKVTLDGVYNVNKGYAEFQCINILSGNEDYYIIDDSSSYYVKNYDHIALYGDSVVENTILD